jgi:uncharacterized membrane protein
MFVEGGTTEVGRHLAASPPAALGTLAFTVAIVYGVVYVSDLQDVRVTRRVLGLFPRRLVGVLGVPLVAAAVGPTAWGRITWAEPAAAVGRVVAAHLPMAVGAALGDILPGT